MTIAEAIEAVRKLAEFDHVDSVAKYIAIGDSLKGTRDEGYIPDFADGAIYQQEKDAKIIESLLQIIKEQNRALYIAQEQLYGVSIGISEQGQNINPHFYITEYSKFGDQARTAISLALEKMKEIAK